MKLDPEILQKVFFERYFKKSVPLALFNSLIEIVTFILFHADIISNIIQCVKYYRENQISWFTITIFVLKYLLYSIFKT